ncbi:hypothetical protein PAHAL_7G168900 [Panicum hallii]|uniref:Uncharacterized protein n=1 Tax=Panicum hallii TaxID=206008 RepID=A0A2T8ICM1_9POAL|nr:hypothetical protein PAHAL_7G168900 [Panicum hallii]
MALPPRGSASPPPLPRKKNRTPPPRSPLSPSPALASGDRGPTRGALSPPHAIVALPPPPPPPPPSPSPALTAAAAVPASDAALDPASLPRRTCSPTACRQSHERRSTHPLRHRSTPTAPLSSLLVHGPLRLIPASRAADEQGDAPLSPNPRAAPGSPASSQPRAASSPNARSSLALRPRKVPLAQPAAVPHSSASRGASPPTCSQPSRGASPPTCGRLRAPWHRRRCCSRPSRRGRGWRRQNKSSLWYARESPTLLCFRPMPSIPPLSCSATTSMTRLGVWDRALMATAPNNHGHGSEESLEQVQAGSHEVIHLTTRLIYFSKNGLGKGLSCCHPRGQAVGCGSWSSTRRRTWPRGSPTAHY